uniref:Uncharacterized protein n=1 Tax=Myoviridae sp. ctZgq1 TaxID=2826666 RepID=A0A8S5LXN7_9CAUD|nr:MAG TPA: hypothetical protein [Myoviridae sp. ctZgq1]
MVVDSYVYVCYNVHIVSYKLVENGVKKYEKTR